MDNPNKIKDSIEILVNPNITPDEFFAFYEKNNLCEVGFGKEVA